MFGNLTKLTYALLSHFKKKFATKAFYFRSLKPEQCIKPPSNFILLNVTRRYFCCDSTLYLLYVLESNFVLFEPYVGLQIFS